MGYSPWGCKESDATNTFTSCFQANSIAAQSPVCWQKIHGLKKTFTQNTRQHVVYVCIGWPTPEFHGEGVEWSR